MKFNKQKNKVRKKEQDNSRKAVRKQKRIQKKVSRHQRYLSKSSHNVEQPIAGPGKFVKRRPNGDTFEDRPSQKKPKKRKSILDQAQIEIKTDHDRHKKLQKEMEKKRTETLLKANEEEDLIIKKLEKQLGMKKTRNINKMFEGDGLDYLLEACDRATQEDIVAAEKHLANADSDSEFEDDIAQVTGKGTNDKRRRRHDSSESAESDSSNEPIEESSTEINSKENLEDKNKSKQIRKSNKYNSESEGSGLEENGSEEDGMDSEEDDIDIGDQIRQIDEQDEEREVGENDKDDKSFEAKNDSENEKSSEPDDWEDIYGRKRDKSGNLIKESTTNYIPPHLRNKELNADSQEIIQLRRQIKSVLNKLAETNMHWACNSIEALYSCNSRNAVNSVFSELWMAATIQPVLTPDRLITEHVALISVLQANVGMEVGAHFLQILVKKFDGMIKSDQQLENKELENLVCSLAQLYNFKIYNASLLYEIMIKLLEDLSEKRIGCVIAALRCVGGVLRREEPLALKDFIHSTQAGVAGLEPSVASGSRLKYLLEILMAIKNNNLNKIPNYDPSYSEHLKKLTKGIIRRGNYVTTLNIKLDDLLNADERGKWWVVGSAWEGSDTLQKKTAQDSNDGEKHKYDKKVLELARKQRMNTDIRRNIFCIIMTAEDYMDAFEKLQHLGLKNQQEREIVHVLLACCLQEKNYNPYYSVLALKFCDFERKFQLSFQYCIWDKIKELANLTKTQMGNLSKTIVHLIMEKGLPLSILKVIEFSDLNKHTVKFMRQTLLSIIMNEDFNSSTEAFRRIAGSPKLHIFRESLRLFMQHFLLKNTEKKNKLLDDTEMKILTERIQQIEKLLLLNESQLNL